MPKEKCRIALQQSASLTPLILIMATVPQYFTSNSITSPWAPPSTKPFPWVPIAFLRSPGHKSIPWP